MKRLFYLNIILSLFSFVLLINNFGILACILMLTNMSLLLICSKRYALDVIVIGFAFCILAIHLLSEASSLYQMFDKLFLFNVLFSINIGLLGSYIYLTANFKALLKPYFVYSLLCLLFVYSFILFKDYYNFETNYRILSIIIIIFGPFLLLVPFQFLLVEYNK